MPAAGYFCPYCRHRAADDWFTRAHADYVSAYALGHLGGGLLGPLQDSVDRLNESGGFISASLDADLPTPVKPAEPNDMRRVDLGCHAAEPVKVSEDWTESVHCLICGSASAEGAPAR